MAEEKKDEGERPKQEGKRGWFRSAKVIALAAVGAAVAAVAAVALLVNIFERKQEARNPFYRVV